ncbi:MAG: hypothetical protein QOG46_1849 [Pseudonocardiales bacterium]|jgi:hypothetical protein|nr:hypothetical protein [Pseudonocardiales bacterium]
MAQWSEPGADKVAAGARRAETGIDTAQRFRPRARRRFPDGAMYPERNPPRHGGAGSSGMRWCTVGRVLGR